MGVIHHAVMRRQVVLERFAGIIRYTVNQFCAAVNELVLFSPISSERIGVLMVCTDARNAGSYGSTDDPGNVARAILSLEEE